MTQLQLRKAGTSLACRFTCCMQCSQLPFPRCIRCAVSMPAHPQLRRAQSESSVTEARTLCTAAPCQGVPMLNNLATTSASPSCLESLTSFCRCTPVMVHLWPQLSWPPHLAIHLTTPQACALSADAPRPRFPFWPRVKVGTSWCCHLWWGSCWLWQLPVAGCAGACPARAPMRYNSGCRLPTSSRSRWC